MCCSNENKEGCRGTGMAPDLRSRGPERFGKSAASLHFVWAVKPLNPHSSEDERLNSSP